MIKQNKVACLLLGAGEGTRLGFPHPKGMYHDALPSSSSLFSLHAMRLLRLVQLAERVEEEKGEGEERDGDGGKREGTRKRKREEEKEGNREKRVGILWYIMTNEKAIEEVMNYFTENS